VPESEESDVQALRQASLWREKGRVIVQADSDSQASLIALARVADAAMRKLNIVPVFIRMKRSSPIASIKDWAKEILAWCEPETLPTALGKAVQFAIDDQQSTPQRLLELETTMLVFIDPPEDRDSGWFNDLLAESRRSGPLILVTRTEPTDKRFDTWAHETIIVPTPTNLIEPYLENHGNTLMALAALDLPLPENILSAIGFSRELFPLGTPFIFETRMGPILSVSAKRFLLDRATEHQIRAAHEACLRMLDSTSIIWSERLRRQKLSHLAGAGRDTEALVEGAELIECYYLDARYAEVTECFEALRFLGKARNSLDTLAYLRVADAYVRTGKLSHARLHLRNCHPEDSLQRAVMLALESEIEKNDGTTGWRERALESMLKAIEACREAQKINELSGRATAALLEYKMNLARLYQYLNYDLEVAEETYREILAAGSSVQGRDLLVAAVERNLAECIVTRSPNQSSKFQEAESLLDDADRRLPKSDPLRAEIAYVRTKLTQVTGTSLEALLVSCAQIARQTGNGMVEAIADAKLLWSCGPIDFDRWHRIERSLTPYHHHGWAIRTIVNGRIRAARERTNQGMNVEALELLRRNLKELAAHPGFDRGTDRDRIAFTLAGILRLSTDEAEVTKLEQQIKNTQWMKRWLLDKGFASLAVAWPQGA